MVLRILNVAEKPSAAKEIVGVLRQGQHVDTRPGRSRYNQIYEFNMNLSGQNANMIFTSVLGHLKSTDFESKFRKWGSCDPSSLLDRTVTSIEWYIAEDKKPLADTLRTESRRADWLILWLDCDSEGEKIAADVADVCKQGKPNILIKRARFSAMTGSDLFRAVTHLDVLNEFTAKMVATRQEIDLRAGSAYTRFLTTQLQKFDLHLNDDRGIISYGPCQFPTLGLVVDRWLQIENFVRRPFWVFDLKLKDCATELEWMRKYLFDEYTAMTLFEMCAEEATHDGHMVTITRVDKRQRSRWRPLPLSTVELQKVASRSLHMSSHRTMEVAEALYNKGLISYPRTETDRYNESYNLKGLISKQTAHPAWGQFASRLLTPAEPNDPLTFKWPRAGPHDDGAHPPIHPTESAPENFDAPEQRKLYEYITKRFLATCSVDAKGAETKTEIRIGVSEFFIAKGLVIEDKGYLEVLHPFEKWTERDMPIELLNVGAQLAYESFTFRQSETKPPPLLQESDLIALMDHHGIGTDATIAEHIQKVLDRRYVEKLHGGRFSPTEIGKALVIAHEQCQLHLARPHMRAKQEEELKRIMSGQMQAGQVLQNALSDYINKFRHLRDNRSTLDQVFQSRFQTMTAQSWTTLIPRFSTCGNCNTRMDLKTLYRNTSTTNGTTRGTRGRARGRSRAHASIGREGADRAVFCSSCDRTLKVPRNGCFEASTQRCPLCNFEVISVKNQATEAVHTVCPKCMNDPPQDLSINPEQKTEEFRCFLCTHNSCTFAKGTPAGMSDVAKCPKCGKGCTIRTSSTNDSIQFISCTAGRNECDFVYWFPRNSIQSLRSSSSACNTCESKKLDITWKRNALPVGAANSFSGCIWCDPSYIQALRSMGGERSIPVPPHPGNRGNGQQAGRGRGRRAWHGSNDIEDVAGTSNLQRNNRSQYRGAGGFRNRYQ